MATDEKARYKDNGDGTVTDTATGLMWTRNANHGKMDWKTAVEYCEKLEFAGHNDWRLPSVRQAGGKPELDTLGRPGGVPGTEPFERLSGKQFPFTGLISEPYWSSVPYGHPRFAWCVKLWTGYVGSDLKTEQFAVWPVRGPVK